MDVEHLVRLFPASWSPVGWSTELRELQGQGWRFVQAIDRVDGYLVILVRAGQPAARAPPPRSPPPPVG